MRPRFGLRARVVILFGVGALVLSALLSIVTLSLTRSQLVDRRQDFAFDSAVSIAEGLNSQITSETNPAGFTNLMNSYVTPDGAQQGMLHRGEYHWVDPLEFTEDQLPESMRRQFIDIMPAQMTYQSEFNDEVMFAVTLPLANVDGFTSYLLATPITDAQRTLDQLRATLFGASVVTTLLGLGFGVYAATRLFSPLSEVSRAAEQIAEGDLSTRLGDLADPDLDRLVHSFNDMSSALEDRIERDARFASDVSHELRSPLMTLTGSVAVLERRRDELPERSQVALDLLSAEIGRFKVLVEDLLEISRFDVGAIELEIEEVLLDDFVRRALLASTGGREVPIINEPGSEDLIVELDKRRIAQVIRNLSGNADKYANGVTQARIVRNGDDIRIEIEDEGPGVPVDERDIIFERFARGSEGGRRGSGSGVGLGLSLVREHLHLHGGTVHVDDRLDGLLGARFVITLPGVVVE